MLYVFSLGAETRFFADQRCHRRSISENLRWRISLHDWYSRSRLYNF